MSSALKVCPQCGTEYPANARFCEVDGSALRGSQETGNLVGSIIAERYHVLKKLGEGGMGQVYLVEHVKMGRKSALKVMHPGMVKDLDAISRFNREAANASRISHPNVAAVYDFGETPDGIIYLAMEFVDGPPLTQIIEQQGTLPPQRAAEIVRQTGEALAVACDMGIVHRDLKPDNIMIARTRDGADLVKVVDFGIAKAANNDAQKVTKTGLVVGTPDYMSPEQLSGDKLDGRSDIYSLGLVAYNMLTGKLPFPSESAQESMIMRLTDRPQPLVAMRPDVSWPDDVQAVMDKALERDVTLRYQTATDFGRALHQAVDRMPQTAAAVASTVVMSSPETTTVPPTRVSSVPSPATRVSSIAALDAAGVVAQHTAAPKKRSMVPIGAGIAAVLVVGLAAFKLMGGASKAPTIADTTHAPAQQMSKPGPTVPAVSTPPTTAAAPPASAAPDFDRLESLAKDSVNAAKALEGVAGVHASNDETKVRVAYVRFLAKLSLGQVDACTELKAVRTIAQNTTKASVIARNLSETCTD
ncbi:MAG TPA: serine/threonine-protein kinase [Gemmatimonadaceae bacterium]|jgi:serine/threonine-protein kinase